MLASMGTAPHQRIRHLGKPTSSQQNARLSKPSAKKNFRGSVARSTRTPIVFSSPMAKAVDPRMRVGQHHFELPKRWARWDNDGLLAHGAFGVVVKAQVLDDAREAGDNPSWICVGGPWNHQNCQVQTPTKVLKSFGLSFSGGHLLKRSKALLSKAPLSLSFFSNAVRLHFPLQHHHELSSHPSAAAFFDDILGLVRSENLLNSEQLPQEGPPTEKDFEAMNSVFVSMHETKRQVGLLAMGALERLDDVSDDVNWKLRTKGRFLTSALCMSMPLAMTRVPAESSRFPKMIWDGLTSTSAGGLEG
eukprot:scaffold748_cov251-Pinguiococcus_pyrenoidosus.AAC.5